MKVTPIKTPVFIKGENLFAFLQKHIQVFTEGIIVVVTSKIVSLSENRVVPLPKNKFEKDTIIRNESDWAIPTKYAWLTKKDGIIMAGAGIDESNANGKLILLPKDSFATAHALRNNILKKYHIKKVGTLITDSRTQPLRKGIIGAALGYAGFRGLRDYTNTKDIFGRPFKFSSTNIADCLATAAVLVMGEGNEKQPLAIIEDAPVTYSSRVNKKELCIKFSDDMYFPLLKNELNNNTNKK